MIDLIDMPWLQPVQNDFRQNLISLNENTTDIGKALQGLAASNLSTRESALFKRKQEKLRASGVDMTPLAPFSLSILSNSTIDLISDCLPVAAARHGVELSVVLGA